MAKLNQLGLNINVRTSSVAPEASAYNGTSILFDITDQRIGIQGDWIVAGTGALSYISVTGAAPITVSKTTNNKIDTYTVTHDTGSSTSAVVLPSTITLGSAASIPVALSNTYGHITGVETKNLTINHNSITTTVTTNPTATLTPGAKFQVINGLDLNNGHATGITVSEYQLPGDTDEKVKAFQTSAKSYILGHADLETTEGEYAYKTSTHYIQNGYLYQGGFPVINKLEIRGESGNVITNINNDITSQITAYSGWALTGIVTYGSGNVVNGVSYENGVATLTTTSAELTDEKLKTVASTNKAYLFGGADSNNAQTGIRNANVYMESGALYSEGKQVALKEDIEEIGRALHFDDNQTLTSSLSTTVAEKIGEVVILSASGVYTGTMSGFTDTQIYEKGDIAIAAATGTGGWVVSQANLNIEDGQTSLSWGATTTLAKIGNVTIDAYLPENPNTDEKVKAVIATDKAYLIGQDSVGTANTGIANNSVYMQNGAIYSAGAQTLTGAAATGTGNVLTGLSYTNGVVTFTRAFVETTDEKVKAAQMTNLKYYLIGHDTDDTTTAYSGFKSTYVYAKGEEIYVRGLIDTSTSVRVLNEDDITWNLI